MDNPFPAEKGSPFLAPYMPPGDKPAAPFDPASGPAPAGPRMAAAPQASPFLERPADVFLPREAAPADAAKSAAAPTAPAKPFPASIVPAAGPSSSGFAPKPAFAVQDFSPAPIPIMPPVPDEPRPKPALAPLEAIPALPPAAPAPAPAAIADFVPVLPASPAVPSAASPAPASPTARGTSAVPKTALRMTDGDAPAPPGLAITTGPSLDGKRVLAYLGVVSVEIVIPNDLLFRNPAPYGELHRIKAAEEQLQRVKRQAFDELEEKARALGAGGIIGATLQFSQFDAVVFLCSAYGTAVKVSA